MNKNLLEFFKRNRFTFQHVFLCIFVTSFFRQIVAKLSDGGIPCTHLKTLKELLLMFPWHAVCSFQLTSSYSHIFFPVNLVCEADTSKHSLMQTLSKQAQLSLKYWDVWHFHMCIWHFHHDRGMQHRQANTCCVNLCV